MTKPVEPVEITEEDFYKMFAPIKNHLDNNASFDGNMFETYGEEIAFVQNLANQNRVITIIECDNEDENAEKDEDGNTRPLLVYSTGLHHVNRLGFFVLDIPYTYEFNVTIKD